MQAPQPAFALSFPCPIWRVIAEPAGTLLVVEMLGEEKLEKHFAAVALPAGKLLWQQCNPVPQRLAQAVALHGQTLYIQVVTTGPIPQPEALIAIDILTQSVRWERPKASWIDITEEGIATREMQYERLGYVLLCPQDGSVRREMLPSKAITAESEGYPVHYDQGNPHTESIAEFIRSRLGVTPVAAFDYVEKENVLIISYYIYQANQYDNFLAVFDRKGRPLWGQKIASALSGAGINTFLTINNLLIFVQEKYQLLGYVL